MTSIDLFHRAHWSGGGRNAATAAGRLLGSAATGIVAAIRRRYARRRDRAAFMALLGKEDWVYGDLGISRADVEWAARLPLHVNATRELERLRAFSMQGR